MKWSEEYATGIPHLDEQHRQIFKVVGDFRVALETGGGEKTYHVLLDFLDHYVHAHFGFEDRCMTEYRCPAAEKNREAHAGFSRSLGDFRTRYASRGYRPEDARELVDTLERWFTAHIAGIDATLREYVAAR